MNSKLEQPLRVEDISIRDGLYPEDHQEVCRRVNCHEELVRALKDCIIQLDEETLGGQILDTARTALAKAERGAQ